jgi:hypothetical protein
MAYNTAAGNDLEILYMGDMSPKVRKRAVDCLKILISTIVYGRRSTFCHQNQNAKNIGNFTTLLKLHKIGTHLKGIEPSFQVVPLFFKSFYVLLGELYHFLKFSQNTFNLP